MEWYCVVWNSDKVSGIGGAQVVYDMLCQGDTSMVTDFVVVDEFYEDLDSRKLPVTAAKGEGFVIMGCMMEYAEKLNELAQELAKKHGLSYYEPQNMTYVGVEC